MDWNISIRGKSDLTAQQLGDYVLEKCSIKGIGIYPRLTTVNIYELAQLFISIGNKYNIRGDIAFLQACLETGWFQFGDDKPANEFWVRSWQNNYSGLGATKSDDGAIFETPAIGVEATIQHLCCYNGLNIYSITDKLYDPRYQDLIKYGKQGIAKTWMDLSGTWAVPGWTNTDYTTLEQAISAEVAYGNDILRMYYKLKGRVNMTKICVDVGHGDNNGKHSPRLLEDIIINSEVVRHKGERIYEYEHNHLLGWLIKNELEVNGFDVFWFDDGSDPSVTQRKRIIKAAECDFSLSIHYDATDNSDTFTSGNGISVFVDDVTPSQFSIDVGTKLIERLCAVQNQRNRGVRSNNLALTNENELGCFAILVENGFMTHVTEVKYMLDVEHNKKKASAYCQTLCEAYNKTYRPLTESDYYTEPKYIATSCRIIDKSDTFDGDLYMRDNPDGDFIISETGYAAKYYFNKNNMFTIIQDISTNTKWVNVVNDYDGQSGWLEKEYLTFIYDIVNLEEVNVDVTEIDINNTATDTDNIVNETIEIVDDVNSTEENVNVINNNNIDADEQELINSAKSIWQMIGEFIEKLIHYFENN